MSNIYKSLKVNLTATQIAQIDELSQKFVYKVEKGKTQKGQDKTEKVKTDTDLTRFLRLRAQGGASDRNLTLLYFAYKSAGSPLLTAEAIADLCNRCEPKIKLSKTYGQVERTLTSRELETCVHFEVMRLCNFTVQPRRNTVEQWLKEGYKGDLIKSMQLFAIAYQEFDPKLVEGELPEKLATKIADLAGLKSR